MSGGRGNDPYYSKDPPKKTTRSSSDVPQEEMKSYRDAVKPIRVETGPDGKKTYYYRCEHCGTVFQTNKRKTKQHAFHERACFDKWQSYGKAPGPLSEKGRESIRSKTREYWSDEEHRRKRMASMKKAMSTQQYREKRKKTAKEVANRPEWRRRQSEARKGKKKPPELGGKISKAKMGHPVSDETRKNSQT